MIMASLDSLVLQQFLISRLFNNGTMTTVEYGVIEATEMKMVPLQSYCTEQVSRNSLYLVLRHVY